MAKNKTIDDALLNLDGFMRQGARDESKLNIPTGHFELDFGLWQILQPVVTIVNTHSTTLLLSL